MGSNTMAYIIRQVKSSSIVKINPDGVDKNDPKDVQLEDEDIMYDIALSVENEHQEKIPELVKAKVAKNLLQQMLENESSDEESSTSERKDEEYAMAGKRLQEILLR
ncbi:hypothetical protein Tco_0455756 [Tanacetum coccineum]